VTRYFFHVVCQGSAYRDAHGQDFANLEDAKARATMIARKLAQQAAYAGCSIFIADEQEKELAHVPIR
jgi:hypothetical protein